jgi:hypothetical protein
MTQAGSPDPRNEVEALNRAADIFRMAGHILDDENDEDDEDDEDDKDDEEDEDDENDKDDERQDEPAVVREPDE